MNYELKTLHLAGSAQRKDVDTFNQPITIVVGVVGQIYEGFENRDAYLAEFPATGLNADEIEALLYTQAQAYVTATYPNT